MTILRVMFAFLLLAATPFTLGACENENDPVEEISEGFEDGAEEMGDEIEEQTE